MGIHGLAQIETGQWGITPKTAGQGPGGGGLRLAGGRGAGGSAKVPNATPESANERAGGQPKVPAAWAGGRGAKNF